MRAGVIAMLFVACSISIWTQQPPDFFDEQPKAPPPNTIEVRFAIGQNALLCDHFQLLVKDHRKILINGLFSSRFQLPTSSGIFIHRDSLDMRISCGAYHWHFQHAPRRIFLSGWWWIGTDYPPFQRAFREPLFDDAAWVQYLIVDPSADSGFSIYHRCPIALQSQQPGPCFPD